MNAALHDHVTERHTPEYKSLLNEITSRQLDARTIDTYADNALEDLIALVGAMTAEYDKHPTITGENSRHTELSAFAYFGMDVDTIERTLDHIADVADSTKRLDGLVMKKRKLVNTVIVPPDSNRVQPVTAGDGSFENPKEKIQKLNTLLLLLSKGLDIDIKDDDEVRITTGALRPNMMRSVSYDLVEIPSLGRVVLVCDEIGNTTYVFDSVACGKNGIDANELGELGKPDLDDLIQSDNKLGRRIDYSKKYVDDLNEALGQPLDAIEKAPVTSILKPKEVLDYIPDGYVTSVDMADQLGISRDALAYRIRTNDSLGTFGTIVHYRRENTRLRLFSPEQQALLKKQNDEMYGGVLDYIPDGYITAVNMATQLDISINSLNGRIERINASGETIRYLLLRTGRGTPTRLFSPETRALLEKQDQELRERAPGHIPEGYIIGLDMAAQLGTNWSTLRSRIRRIDNFGEITYCLQPSGRMPLCIFSPEQQELLRQQDAEIKLRRGRKALVATQTED